MGDFIEKLRWAITAHKIVVFKFWFIAVSFSNYIIFSCLVQGLKALSVILRRSDTIQKEAAKPPAKTAKKKRPSVKKQDPWCSFLFPGSRNHHMERNNPVWIAVKNSPPVPGGNRLCGRQPNAIPTGWSGTRGICPVETIKITRELGCVDPFTRIGHRNTNISPVLG